ncbi:MULTISPECIES: replication initiation and membrane attachment family protein [Turicibacter]|jgi:replication initiation and membrane attachment protein|uniref:Replication initiation and membrane attachment protein n=3 Tax=Turicibacter sanguinis TaxID=154288 RepID=A0A173U354_9FIRM|nr:MULTISPECIES: DnaD domain protein [Turicibacter]EFF62971.1 replication initiation and membrane attachment protein [Turicibacter sanguinis PC909]EGC92115.1 replication initiation and membrane attachment protein, DnaB/DnaD family [Turicibacter sp. HGF1]MBP3904248.1 DnaD domain protein [Turicibacter sp.]MCU7191439.1 DnaD domain protein [Turicibacter sanguinis]MCU7196594.1 DnaD domain protein [Turicibacter sanguinis]
MGVSLKPNTTFDLSPIQMMTSEEIQVLTLLYQPIIGPQAVSLFTTLNTLALKKQEQSLTHHLLLQLLNTNIEEFLEWRYKLEAVGLVSVYITEESHHITYVLKRPMKARAFFSDGIINVFLNLKVGNVDYQALKQFFIEDAFKAEGKNVSKPFNEVFDTTVLLRNSQTLQASPLPVSEMKREGVELEKAFNEELLFALLKQFGLDDQILSDKLLDQINKIAFLYKLDESELARLIFDALDSDGFVNLEVFRKQAKQYFQFLNKGKPIEVVEVSQVNQETMISEANAASAKEKQLLIHLSQHPLSFLKFKQHQKEPVPADRQLVEWLVVDQQMPSGVVNVLIDYVLNISDGRLPKQLVEKIAGEWQRKEIDNTEKAIAQVKSTLKAKQKRENEKTMPAASKPSYQKSARVVRQEQVPDWLKAPQTQESNKKTLSEEDLQKIERMKQLQSQILNGKG